MRISDWSSDVCSSDLQLGAHHGHCKGQAPCIYMEHGDDGAHHVIGREPQRIRRSDGHSVQHAGAVGIEHALGVTRGARGVAQAGGSVLVERSEEHTSELQSLMRTSYAVFCLKKKK